MITFIKMKYIVIGTFFSFFFKGRISTQKDVTPVVAGSPSSPVDEGVNDMSTASLISSTQSASSFE